jgi:hypothetical protein
MKGAKRINNINLEAINKETKGFNLLSEGF